MSKLEQLINELCPNGVEYKAVEDVATITRGRVISKDYINSNQGIFPVYSSQTENNGELGYISTYDFDGEYLTWTTDGANAGSVFYRTGKFSITNVCGLIKISDTNILTRFLYFVLYVEAKKHVNYGMGNPKLMSNVMAKIKVPLPPLPIQDEIVRILDKFTELTAELTARKQQYEYYRDQLISFRNDMPLVELGKLSTDMYRGAGIKRDEVSSEGTPCVRYGEIYTTYNVWFDKCVSKTMSGSKTFEYGDILFAITGESVEEIAKSCAYVGNEKCFAGGDIVVMKHEQNPKYMAYALSTTMAQKQKSKGRIKSKVVHSNIPAIKEIKIPIPFPKDIAKSLAEQQRIVDILDRFNKLCNDISERLPAEIEARQKQYEYYRDKLLTFKKKEAAENE